MGGRGGSEMKKVYHFYWDCGRSGHVEGHFVSTPGDIANHLGKEVWFGEILGKHSEIYGTLEASDLSVISDDPEVVEIFEKLFPEGVGYNPLEYIDDEDPEEFCDDCFAGTDSSEHFEKCNKGE